MIPSLGTVETPDAAFLVVDLDILNNDRTASTLPPLKLVDAQGREYDESSKRTFMPGAFDILKELNSGVSSRGYAVFDVPRGQYNLQVSGGFESGEHALVDLSPSEPSESASSKPSITPVQSSLPNAGINNERRYTREWFRKHPGGYELEQLAPAGSPSNSSSSSQLEFAAGVRLLIHVVSISRQPDGSFTFRGTLLQPVALADGSNPLDQGTKLSGWGTVNGGHATAVVTRFTAWEADYSLQAPRGEKGKIGSGPAIELDPGKVLEVFLASASVYEKTARLPAW